MADETRKGFVYGAARFDPNDATKFAGFGATYLGVTDEQIDKLYGVMQIPEVAEAYQKSLALFLNHARQLGIQQVAAGANIAASKK